MQEFLSKQKQIIKINNIHVMKKFSLLMIVLGVITMISCKDSKTAEPEVVTVETEGGQEVYAIGKGNVKFKDEDVADVFAQYLRLQTALINTDSEEAQIEAEKLAKMIDLEVLEASDDIKKISKEMAGTRDIETIRKSFEYIDEWMLERIEGNIKSGTLYRQYCPMAFNDKGAYWISPDKNILNPYFGDKMLRCGRVDMEIN